MKTIKFTTKDYKLLSVVLTDKVFAVLAQEHPEGGHYLERFPLDAIGVASVVESYWEVIRDDNDSHVSDRIIRSDPPYRHIVGLELAEGWFQIINEASNFAGLCKEADDPYECTGELNMSKYCELKPPPPVVEETP